MHITQLKVTQLLHRVYKVDAGPHTHCDHKAVDWIQQGQILLSTLLQIKSTPFSKI